MSKEDKQRLKTYQNNYRKKTISIDKLDIKSIMLSKKRFIW